MTTSRCFHLLSLPALLLALVACETSSVVDATGPTGATSTKAAAPLPVVATFSVLADFTRVLGGDAVTVTSLVGPAADVHRFDPSPGDLRDLREAGLVIENGLALQSWLDPAYTASGSTAPRVVASEAVSAIDWHGRPCFGEATGGEETVDAAASGCSGCAHDHACSTEAHAACGHAHGAADPHVWLDPLRAKAMVRSIAAALTEALPAEAEAIAGRRDAYLAELDELHTELAARFATIPSQDRQLITAHHSLGYFAARYGFQVRGSGLPDFSTEGTAVSGRQLAELVEHVRQHRVRAVFPETMVDDRLLRTLAAEADIGLADPLFTGALGTTAPADSYLGMMRVNADRIVAALGPDPAP